MKATATKNSALGAETMPIAWASCSSASCQTARPRITTALSIHSSA